MVGGRLGFFFCFVLIFHYSTQLFNQVNYFPQVKSVLLMYIIPLYLSCPVRFLLCFLLLADGEGLLERLLGIWWLAKVIHHKLLDIPKKDFVK